MAYPHMVRLKQQFPRPRAQQHSVGRGGEALMKLGLNKTIKPKQTVALTAGSRGIANIPIILKGVVSFMKDLARAVPGGLTLAGSAPLLQTGGEREVMASLLNHFPSRTPCLAT